MAKVIVVEGGDKLGKTTQVKLLCDALGKQIHPHRWLFSDEDYVLNRAVRVKVPVVGPSARLIYWSLRNGLAKTFPNLFQLAQFVNKLSFQLFELPRLVRDNDYVILDRWSLSALAYGPPTGANERFTRYLNSFLMKPDIVIVLTGEPFDRGEGANDTYDSDDELQHKVRQAYECLAIEECHPCVWVKGSREDVLERILNQLYCNGIVPQSMRPRSDRYATVEEVRT